MYIYIIPDIIIHILVISYLQKLFGVGPIITNPNGKVVGRLRPIRPMIHYRYTDYPLVN